MMIESLLIANRGEIARRIIRTAQTRDVLGLALAAGGEKDREAGVPDVRCI